MDSTQSSARVNRKVLVTDPEALFSMQQQETNALANMLAADSSRIDTLVQSLGEVQGTVGMVHGKVNDVARGVDKLSDALAVLVRHEVTMENSATAVRTMVERQGKFDERLHQMETKAPGWDEARMWLIRAGLLVLGTVGMAILLLVMNKPGGV